MYYIVEMKRGNQTITFSIDLHQWSVSLCHSLHVQNGLVLSNEHEYRLMKCVPQTMFNMSYFRIMYFTGM